MARMNRKMHDAAKPRKKPNLPKAAVNVLTQWLEVNGNNPYLSKFTKRIMMEVTNLTRIQTCNRFINSRRRALPNVLKAKDVDKSHNQLNSEESQCFNRDSFVERAIIEELFGEELPHLESNPTPVFDDYNLRLLAEVAAQMFPF